MTMQRHFPQVQLHCIWQFACAERLSTKGVTVAHVPIPRKISDINGIKESLSQVKKMCNENHYNLLHCHSPIGSVVARLAAKGVRKKGTR